MLIKFSVGNFLSFKEVTTLDMSADSLKEMKEHLHIPYLYNVDLKLVKSMALYGHNSHGKSNLIKAYSFFHKLILRSFSLGKASNEIGVEPFSLNISMADQPSIFEVVFLIKDTKYRYGFKITNQRILEEWLYYAESKLRENPLFHRYEQDFRDIGKSWNKESNNRIVQAQLFTKQTNLFLSVLLTQDNIPRIEAIANWFKGNLICTGYNFESLINGGAGVIYSNLQYRSLILKFIKGADLGFTSIFDKISNMIQNDKIHSDIADFLFDTEKRNFDLFTSHKVYNENYEFIKSIEFDLVKKESSGSIKYFIISCFLAYAINNSQLIFIDELDASLHTNLLVALINTFHNPKVNVTGAQLIFTTHNTALLDKKLRRDQVILVNKNDFGESSLQKMHTADNPIRIDKSVEKEYRSGELGGVSKKVNKNDSPTLF